MGKVYTVSPNHSFVDALAAWLLDSHKEQPLALSRVRLLLPTQRAIRAMQEAFLRLEPEALMLPRMDAIGGLDSDELMLLEPTGLGQGSGQLAAKQSLNKHQRIFLLTRLVLAAGATLAPRPDTPELNLSFQQALRMAIGLGQLMDQAETEGVTLSSLSQVEIKTELAHHWENAKHFLEILSVVWPQILSDKGLVSVAEQRRRLMEQQAEVWHTKPPTNPVIVAGSTGSIPSTRALLSTIANLPTGMLIVPGLDQNMDASAWEMVGHDPSHPQYNLKQLIDACEVSVEDVALLPGTDGDQDRQLILSHAMLPANATEAWRDLPPKAYPQALDGLCLMSVKNAQAEAQAIAVIMRQVLETPTKTAALITPDRLLARRVIIEMRRWGVNLDDSAGLPLKNTTAGLLFRQTAHCLAEGMSPVTLLSVLKHPYALIDDKREKNKRLLYQFERKLLRGEKPAAGIPGLQAHIDSKQANLDEELIDFSQALISRFEAFINLGQEEHAFEVFLTAHLALLTALDKENRLWHAHNGGEELSAFIENLSLVIAEEGESFAPLTAEAYVDSLEALINGETLRQKYGLHPRLSIWGTMEGRLQRADCLILSGLNEGTWPSQTDAGPWLSRPMRKELELPSTERKIGLSSHDFVQACGAGEVYLTRAMKDGGAETRPSRLLQRLETVMAKLDHHFDTSKTEQIQAWVEALETNNRDLPHHATEFQQPQFAPPIEKRPADLSITEVETLIRDPYAIYLKRVLKINQLDPIETDISIAERGNLIHEVLDNFIRNHPQGRLPHLALQELMVTGREAFERLNAIAPGATAFWWPRFERIANWFVAEETKRRNAGTLDSYVEIKGETHVGGVKIRGRADRIDKLADGRFEIIDYKTGSAPKRGQVTSFNAPQLLLEALILEAGGFDDIKGNAQTAQLAYWKLNGSGSDVADLTVFTDKDKMPLHDLLEELEAFLIDYLSSFNQADTAYVSLPDPAKAPTYQTYKNLVREDEWRLGSSDGDEVYSDQSTGGKA